MTATALSAAQPESKATAALPPVRPGALWLAVVVVAAWVIFLAVITYRTANPPLVNRVQIEAADLILLGHVAPGTTDQFQVHRELKLGRKLDTINLLRLPAAVVTGAGDWIVPVTKTGSVYSVTSGEFPNLPQHPPLPKGQMIWKVAVPPQSYPATDEMLEQIDEILRTQPGAAQIR